MIPVDDTHRNVCSLHVCRITYYLVLNSLNGRGKIDPPAGYLYYRLMVPGAMPVANRKRLLLIQSRLPGSLLIVQRTHAILSRLCLADSEGRAANLGHKA